MLDKKTKARTELRNYVAQNQIKIYKTFNVKVPLTIVNMNNEKFTDWIYENLLNFKQFSFFEESEIEEFFTLLNKFISVNEEEQTLNLN